MTATTTTLGPATSGALRPGSLARLRSGAWILVLLADVGLLAWAAMAFLAPERLMGPGTLPILPAGYEGFTGYSWHTVESVMPRAAEYTTLLFRMYGLYGTAFSLLAIAVAVTAFRQGARWAWVGLLVGNTLTYVGAMTYDQVVRAVGPFELTEYLGLAVFYVALAVTAGPVFRRRRI